MKIMIFYKNMFIVTGIIATVYLMLKLYANQSKRASEKDSNSEEESEDTAEQQTNKKTVESGDSKPKPVKRKVEDTKKAMKILRPKPNFFVAFQVNDVGIHKKVKKLQEKLISKNPSLFPALVNVSTLHVTLAVTHLAGEEDINVIKKKLDEWAEKNLEKHFDKPCILSFTGVSTFNSAVAYVGIEQCENYKKISELSKNINNIISSSGYTIDKRSFTPHLTFLKLSKDVKLLRLKKNLKTDFESLKECKEHFGKQQVRNIQLLSMGEPKDKFGYYKCYHQIKISDEIPNMDHSECCTPIVKPRKSAK